MWQQQEIRDVSSLFATYIDGNTVTGSAFSSEIKELWIIQNSQESVIGHGLDLPLVTTQRYQVAHNDFFKMVTSFKA